MSGEWRELEQGRVVGSARNRAGTCSVSKGGQRDSLMEQGAFQQRLEGEEGGRHAHLVEEYPGQGEEHVQRP